MKAWPPVMSDMTATVIKPAICSILMTTVYITAFFRLTKRRTGRVMAHPPSQNVSF